jgi:plasmid stabilization system protein ParE
VFRVTVEAEAKNNIRTHYQNLKARAPGSAYPADWYYGIRAAIRDLAASAEQMGLAYEDRYFAETIRQRLYASYKILFTIRGDRVHVLHIRHQAQDPDDLFA